MLFRIFVLACCLGAVGVLPVQAADMQMKMVDRDCWIDVYDDDNFDVNDPHTKIAGPHDFASLKTMDGGRDWSNDIESVIVGPNAVVHAYSKKDYQGTEIAFTNNQRVSDLGKLKMGNDIESLKISCGKN